MSGNVAAILLAAGRSRRMGSCKQLLPLGKATVIDRCLTTLQQGGIGDIVVVVSESGQQIAAAARKHDVRVVVNRVDDGDMASSVRAGRDALDAGTSGIVVALSDCPLVSPETVSLLVHLHDIFPDGIITPAHEGRRGHPLLFARTILDELAEEMTLRDVVQSDLHRIYEVPVDDIGILMDMDTPDDYVRLAGILDQSTGVR
ncbi:MAG: glycosyl transferase [Geobacteraceae bacterium GWC2_53_11]|nr:MAG: glycosyl transferase [Geobacteraceae bacterium GWC2_53_11]